MSLIVYHREIFVNVSHIEPIFHLETLATAYKHPEPEKKWFLLLVKLARETLIAVRIPSRLIRWPFDPFLGKTAYQLLPSDENVLRLRQRLLRVLEIYKYETFLQLL